MISRVGSDQPLSNSVPANVMTKMQASNLSELIRLALVPGVLYERR